MLRSLESSMANRPRLALAIPTFNRTQILLDNLKAMQSDLRRCGVPVYVSDDSPDDNIRDALTSFNELHYRHNSPASGHDRNLATTLVWPDADYVWLLGDSHRIKEGQIAKIIAFLDDQDLLFVNSHSSDRRMIPTRSGQMAHVLLREMLWHQTMTGATIYHRRVCDWVLSKGENLTIKPDFPQLSIMLGYASERNLSIGWFGEQSIQSTSKPSYWRNRILPVFVDNWTALIEAFPAVITCRHQKNVIRSHSARMDLFRPTVMLDLRLSGAFNWGRLLQRRFRRAMHLPLPLLMVILLIPRFLITYIKRILN